MDTGKDEHTFLAFTNVACSRNAAFLGQGAVVASRCSSSIGIGHDDFRELLVSKGFEIKNSS